MWNTHKYYNNNDLEAFCFLFACLFIIFVRQHHLSVVFQLCFSVLKISLNQPMLANKPFFLFRFNLRVLWFLKIYEHFDQPGTGNRTIISYFKEKLRTFVSLCLDKDILMEFLRRLILFVANEKCYIGCDSRFDSTSEIC